MKLSAALLLASFSIALGEERESAAVRVACLGDSITFGAKVNPNTESYPAQLQQLLGMKFVVRNFGAGGATMIRRGKPNAFQQLVKTREFEPNIVVINFGINDTRGRGVDYWDHAAEFVPDARTFIKSIAAIPTRPRILLCLPTSNVADLPGMSEDRRANVGERLDRLDTVREWLRNLGKELSDLHVSVVDLEIPTRDHPEFFDVDGVHLKPIGYKALAQVLRPEVERAAADLR